LQFWYGGPANAVESASISMPKISDVTTSAVRSMTTPADDLLVAASISARITCRSASTSRRHPGYGVNANGQSKKIGKSPHDFRRPIPPHLTHAAQTALPSERIVLMYVSKARLAIGTSLMALTFGMLGGGTAYAFQEHMFNARNDLQQAVNELQQAEHDKGGHRENAVGLVQQAINQVNQGIQAGGGTP
jgi:hypothetical protein